MKLVWDFLLVNLFLITRVNIPVADESLFSLGVNKNKRLGLDYVT